MKEGRTEGRRKRQTYLRRRRGGREEGGGREGEGEEQGAAEEGEEAPGQRQVQVGFRDAWKEGGGEGGREGGKGKNMSHPV